MKYTVSQMKKMNTERLEKLTSRISQAPKSQRKALTLRRANKILEARYS